jgi:hypothetical protein
MLSPARMRFVEQSKCQQGNFLEEERQVREGIGEKLEKLYLRPFEPRFLDLVEQGLVAHAKQLRGLAAVPMHLLQRV